MNRQLSGFAMGVQRFGAVALAALMAAASVGCGGAKSGKTVTLRASLILGETSDWYRGLDRWKDLVEKRSDGRIKVNIFPQASLASGKQATELEMVQTGGIDVSLESSILLSGIEPAFSVWSLPFLFRDYAAVDSALTGERGRSLLALLPAKGLIGLGYGHNGFRQITNSVRPIRTPSDLDGLKIRVPAISLYMDVFRALGADPTPMNFGEVFLALQQGTIDGQENPVSVIRSARLAEVQKYLTVWNYSYDPIVLCMNKGVWDRFSPSDQKLLSGAADDALAWQRKLVEEGEPRDLDALRAEGMQITRLTPDEVEAFRKAVSGIDQEYEGKIGADRLRLFRGAKMLGIPAPNPLPGTQPATSDAFGQ